MPFIDEDLRFEKIFSVQGHSFWGMVGPQTYRSSYQFHELSSILDMMLGAGWEAAGPTVATQAGRKRDAF